MKLKIFLFLISANFIFSQGYLLSDNNDFFNSLDSYSKEGLGFSDELPSRYDLKKYVPNIGDQKDSGSCVAWAISYYAASIIYNKSYDITDSEGKWANRFDPWFIYNQLSWQNKEACEEGLTWEKAFEKVEQVGNKRFTQPPFDLHCSKSWDMNALRNTVAVTQRYRFWKWEKIIPENYNAIKSEIVNYNYPVVIGISHYGNGLDIWNSSTGYFKPNYDLDNREGHAMTIVGYDDYVNGGSFLVVNSWGKEFGKDGYMWMKYSDFKKYAHVAFAIHASYEELDELESSSYGRKTWDDGNQVYEGEIRLKSDGGWSAEGYGINYNISLHKYTVGRWVNNKRHGKFYVVENKKWRTENYENGNQVFGFASSEDEQLEKYVQTLFKDEEISFMN